MVPRFLTRELALLLHEEQLAAFGGAAGLRDVGLLESALAQPMAIFDGQYLHADLHAMAGVDLFHIVRNHPFIDGNKRTGLLACLVFLELNGISTPYAEELHDTTMGVAEGSVTKDEVSRRLRLFYPGPLTS